MNAVDEPAALAARERLLAGCETMKHLLHGLLDSKGRVADEIHAIRKLGKSLRGGFALFRLDKSAAAEIQAIGRLLSAPRDAVSRFNTWQRLGWVGAPEVTTAISGLLEQSTHSAARRPPPEAITWCVARVDAACAELLAVPAASLAEQMNHGLRKLERKAIKRCHRLDHRRQEDFHKARKAVKAWLGALGFVPAAESQNPGDSLAHQLAERLGDENDLATLGEWLNEHGFTKRFAPDLWNSLAKHRRRLQRKLVKDGAKLGSIPAKPHHETVKPAAENPADASQPDTHHA